MNILIVGNGFDLAHGFPTRYKDFLKFINEVNEYCEKFKFTGKCISDDDKKDKDYFDFLIDLDGKDDFEYINNVFELSNNNLWVKYFNNIFENNSYYLGDTWIDFENEIAKAINYMHSNGRNKKYIASKNYTFEIDSNLFFFITKINKNDILIESTKIINGETHQTKNIYLHNYINLKKELLIDLKDFIRCLEIYICIHINNINPNKRITELDDIDSIDAVLSFNYTNTYERLYGDNNTKYHYIHGKANINNTVDSCQLVLGINEYSDTSDDNDTEFIQYEKFFQRIYKRNGCEYTKWIEDKDNEDKEYNIYIYGHSLDSTDADVLSEFIKLENCKITIFHYNDEALEGQITNLTKIVGRKKMIEFTSGSSPKIVFQKQNDVAEIDEDINIEITSNVDFETIYSISNSMAITQYNLKKLNDSITSYIEPTIHAINSLNSKLSVMKSCYERFNTINEITSSWNSKLQMINSVINSPAANFARTVANHPAISMIENKANLYTDLYPYATQAAHNDYLDEPGEKENIQSDLDEMDSWDNEE